MPYIIGNFRYLLVLHTHKFRWAKLARPRFLYRRHPSHRGPVPTLQCHRVWLRRHYIWFDHYGEGLPFLLLRLEINFRQKASEQTQATRKFKLEKWIEFYVYRVMYWKNCFCFIFLYFDFLRRKCWNPYSLRWFVCRWCVSSLLPARSTQLSPYCRFSQRHIVRVLIH